jgi:Spy/CpxP family protein refolding chaperone
LVKLGNFAPVVTLVTVFLLGGVAGAGIATAYVHREVGDFVSEPRFRERARMRGLTRLLDLSDAQRDRVRAVMQSHHRQRIAAYSEMIDKCGHSMKEEKERMDAEIRAVLTPAQRDKFDALVRRQDERLFIRGPAPP